MRGISHEPYFGMAPRAHRPHAPATGRPRGSWRHPGRSRIIAGVWVTHRRYRWALLLRSAYRSRHRLLGDQELVRRHLRALRGVVGGVSVAVAGQHAAAAYLRCQLEGPLVGDGRVVIGVDDQRGNAPDVQAAYRIGDLERPTNAEDSQPKLRPTLQVGRELPAHLDPLLHVGKGVDVGGVVPAMIRKSGENVGGRALGRRPSEERGVSVNGSFEDL